MVSVPFISSLEQFVFPQHCNNCSVTLNEDEYLYCHICRVKKLQLTKMGNWVQNLEVHDYLDFAYSLYWFDEVLQAYVHQLKYSGWHQFLPNLIQPASVDCILPPISQMAAMVIPLHKVKQRDRGFNQAELIAEQIAPQWNLPVVKNKLHRIKYTSTQTQLNIDQRQKNMEMAFETTPALPEAVLLVDDVLTTGSTANACAKVLRDNGCRWVGIFTLGTPKLKNKSSVN